MAENRNPIPIINRYIIEATKLLVYYHKEVFDKDYVIGF